MSERLRMEDFPMRIEPLTADEGGGYTVTFPDLPGCRADGATIEAALADAQDAFEAWVAAQVAEDRALPVPNQGGETMKFVVRLPSSLHAWLSEEARREGVSMNTMLMMLLTQARAEKETEKRVLKAYAEFSGVVMPQPDVSTASGVLRIVPASEGAAGSRVDAPLTSHVGSGTNVNVVSIEGARRWGGRS